jgi:hypothetical protein
MSLKSAIVISSDGFFRSYYYGYVGKRCLYHGFKTIQEANNQGIYPKVWAIEANGQYLDCVHGTERFYTTPNEFVIFALLIGFALFAVAFSFSWFFNLI